MVKDDDGDDDKYKLYEIYRRMWYVQRNMFWLKKHGFATKSQSQKKTVHRVETHWLSGKEKVLGASSWF